MIICHCHRVTAKDAHAACSGPDADWRTVVKETRAATGCGACVRSLRRTVEEALASRVAASAAPVAAATAVVAQTVAHAG